MTVSTWLLMAALCAPGAAAAAENPFVGSWKFDAARSKLVAETVEYRDLGDGRMHFSNGATLSYDFGLDGKDYKTAGNRSIAWKPLPDGSWQTTIKIDGKATETSNRTISADGKQMTVLADGVLPDGTPYKHKKHYARVGAGEGLAGTWRNTEVDTGNMPDGYVISENADGTLTWAIPTDKQTLTGRFDGSDLPLSGPTAPPNTVFAITRLSSRKIAYVMKTNGKPGQYGTVTISADGDTFTEESWLPGRENEKSTGVLVRYKCPATDSKDPAWLCAGSR
ncbi:hypothetical protein M2650_14475 [Luteimonas sp. SX5]|uniref:Uncharacterized protein n=1 Tax=Luteimonas galliterrae TaxID=2940486 RepID=A0ABT0MLQ5_9GAMM|nr:hypothetical protein [Luteimonas galliterrae]MCL1635832.1 hypothetical protein [Luteimonas galliterrae]